MRPPELVRSEDVAWFRDDGPSMPGAVRRACATLARRLGFGEDRLHEVALAVTEAAVNVHRHADDGSVLVRALRTSRVAGVEIMTVDTGPGMRDVPHSVRDGISSAGTLGIGLGAIERLADGFDLHSLPGRGTVLTARFWAEPQQARRLERHAVPVVGITRPISGEQVCGDAWAARPAASAGRGRLLVLVCDGLGHGPLAARASARATDVLRSSTSDRPQEIMAELHQALRGTRGGAAAVALIDPVARAVDFCGVGNVVGAVVGHGPREGLLSVPGIVGHQMRALRTFTRPLPPGAALVVHSDGLTDRWTLDRLPGVLDHDPLVVAGHLLREAGVRRDDAVVVVAGGPEAR